MIDEKRKYKRINHSINIKFDILGDHINLDIPESSFTKDISEGGFLFRTKRLIPVGSILKLKFFIENSENFIPAEAKVVRTEEVIKNKLYEIAIEFTNIKKEDIEKLSNFVSNK